MSYLFKFNISVKFKVPSATLKVDLSKNLPPPLEIGVPASVWKSELSPI